MAKWLVWNNTQNRVEVPAVFPNQTDADAWILNDKLRNRPAQSQGDTLVAKQVD
jgi:hypothetical protein